MGWYSLFSPDVAKWVCLAIFVVAFIFILFFSKKVKIETVSLIGAALVVLLGITSPFKAISEAIDWDVLGLLVGYGMLAMSLKASKLPEWLANEVLKRFKKEKTALLLICIIAMALSIIIANPEVVIMLAPLAIELCDKMKGNLVTYLIAVAVSSNVVTTVTMIADPPSLILADYVGMEFFDFYWFQNKISLGSISIFCIVVAALVLAFQFRKMNTVAETDVKNVKVAMFPTVLFFVSVLLLAFIPWDEIGAWGHRGFLGLATGLISILWGIIKNGKSSVLGWFKEFSWSTILFLIGIFTLVYSVNSVGLLEDFANLIASTGITSPSIYLAILIWVSVLLSGFIDNVPYTVIMLPVCQFLATSLGVNPIPFYFGVLVGTGMGGNLTPTGATANVVATQMLADRGKIVTVTDYMRVAWPFTFAAVATGHILLQIIWM
jgi:Na+/H+ antiporter NhaD/arsenite permease-like protein